MALDLDLRQGELVEVVIKDFNITNISPYGSIRGNRDDIEVSTRRNAEPNEWFIHHTLLDTYGAVEIRKVNRNSYSKNTTSSSEFKPQPGDVYEAARKLWYCREYEGGTGTIVIATMDEDESYSDGEYSSRYDNISAFRRLNPVLVMRDGRRVNVSD